MAKKGRGYVRIDKLAAGWIPTDSRCSKVDALVSLTIDIENGNLASARAYAKRWKWSRKRVISFFRELGMVSMEGNIWGPPSGPDISVENKEFTPSAGASSGATSLSSVFLLVFKKQNTRKNTPTGRGDFSLRVAKNVANFWSLRRGLSTHKKFPPPNYGRQTFKAQIKNLLDDGITEEQICCAIDTAARCLEGEEYRWSYRWKTPTEFLFRHGYRFLDAKEAMDLERKLKLQELNGKARQNWTTFKPSTGAVTPDGDEVTGRMADNWTLNDGNYLTWNGRRWFKCDGQGRAL